RRSFPRSWSRRSSPRSSASRAPARWATARSSCSTSRRRCGCERASGATSRCESLPSRERPDCLARRQLLRPDGDELPALDLVDQHLVLVLVRVPFVVGELHLAVERVPAAGLEGLADLLAVAVRLGR